MAATVAQVLPPPMHRSRTSTAGSPSTPLSTAARSSAGRPASVAFPRSQSFSGPSGQPSRQKALSGPTKPAFLYTYSSSLAVSADSGDSSPIRREGSESSTYRPDYLRPRGAGHRLVQSRTMPLGGDGDLNPLATDDGQYDMPLKPTRKETLPADYWVKAKRVPAPDDNTGASTTAAMVRSSRTQTSIDRAGEPLTSNWPALPASVLGRRPIIVEELEAKIVVLGSAGVGKTSIIRRFTLRKFGPTKTTVGSGLFTRKQVVDGVHVRLQLWDAAGQERYRSLAPMYYRGAHVAILVYDVTRRASFDELESWLGELREKGPIDVVIHVVGAKADLEGQREVDLPTARRKLQAWLNSSVPPFSDLKSDIASARPTPTLSADGDTGAGSGFFSGRMRRKSGDWASAGFGMDPPTPLAAVMEGTRGAQPIRRKSEEWSRQTPLLSEELSPQKSPAATGSGSGSAVRRGTGSRRDKQDPQAVPSVDAEDDTGLEGIEVWETSASTSKGIEPLFLHITRQLIDRGDQLERERLRRARESVTLNDGDGATLGAVANSASGLGTSFASNEKPRRLGGSCCA